MKKIFVRRSGTTLEISDNKETDFDTHKVGFEFIDINDIDIKVNGGNILIKVLNNSKEKL